MLLRKLLEACKVEISVPEFLLNLHIENEEAYCRYALQQYFTSQKFTEDVKVLQLEYEDYLAQGKNEFSLVLVRRPNRGQFGLTLLPSEEFFDLDQ